MNCVSLRLGLCKSLGLKIIEKPVFLRGMAFRFVCVVFLSSMAPWAYSQSYTFTTLAGVPGAAGTNDGINQGAQFSFPTGVVPDKAGNLYVADFLNHAVRKMTSEGTNWSVTTIAGLPGALGYADGTNTDARFNRPAGIAIDPAGNLFVAERYNHTIRKITPSGTNWVVSTVAGTAGVPGHNDGTNTEAQFYLPSGIAIDDSNHLYVADTANFTVREIVPIGTNWVVTTIAGTPLNFGFSNGINFQAQFNYPYGIALSSSGKLYVADSGNNAVREMTRSGTDWTVGTIAGLSGKPGTADGGGSFAAFNFPTGIAIDSGGVLYIADQSNNSIRKILPSPSGWSVSTLAGQPQNPGSVDGTGTNALFKKPWGIAVDAGGALFVADYSNSTIREGIPAAMPVPELQILLSNGQVVLTWPAWASNYVLETSAVLDAANGWLAVTNGITLAGETFVLTNEVDAGAGFYRLR
jgi:hypothetical protein